MRPNKKTQGIVVAREWNELLDYVEEFRVSGGPGVEVKQSRGGQAVGLADSADRILWLVPEYPGAVLYDSSESNTGEMYGYLDTGTGHHAYVWETDEESAQEFSISVRFPVPWGFRRWTDCVFWAKCDSGGEVELTNAYGTAGNSVLSAPVTVTATSWTEQGFDFSGGVWQPDGLMRMLFRLEAPAGGKVYLAEIGLGYRAT